MNMDVTVTHHQSTPKIKLYKHIIGCPDFQRLVNFELTHPPKTDPQQSLCTEMLVKYVSALAA